MTRLQWLDCWDRLRERVSNGPQTSFGRNQLLDIMNTIERDMVREVERTPSPTNGLLELRPRMNGLWCGVCHSPQYDTPSGPVCKNGHGDAEGLTLDEIESRNL